MSTAAEYTWTPSSERAQQANVTRLMRAQGVEDIDAMRRWSVEDVGRYWQAVIEDLGIPFREQPTSVLDVSRGPAFPEWFPGGTLNIVDACLARWADDPETADQDAVVHEREDGTVRRLTFAELSDEVGRAAAGLARLGVRRGDAVAIFLPMIPEAVVSLYAAASLGAIVVPLFSGFAPNAIAARLRDADVKVVICADGTVRRERRIEMLPLVSEAVRDCPSVEHVVLVENIGSATSSARPGAGGLVTVPWASLVDTVAERPVVESMTASDPLLLAYTSGTTGRPKGAVHTHEGFLVKTASEVAYSFDVSAGDVFCWITDMGWIMGPLSIVGTHANGATLLLYEGSPDVPDLHRLWRLVESHRVSMLGVSPTLIRTLRIIDDPKIRDFDLLSVHTLGSTGEPWDPESYAWLAKDVFDARVPVINFSGGTEVGGSFLAPYPVEEIRSCSLGGPSLGMDVDVVGAEGTSVRGEIGELVCRQPWPSMTRGVWKDEERYLEAYWSTFPGMWRHGDYALIEDGQWFIRGRSDDVMNVAGKRLAPAEVEAIMARHPQVAEAAVVGMPDATKGEAVWAFWVPRGSLDDGQVEQIGDELRRLIATELGKPFAPSRVTAVSSLPKTRSAKIMRRAIRAAAQGSDPGDLSGAENPEALEVIRAALRIE